jgi:hypothetical protein
MQDAQTKAFEENKAFFAFGQDQFNEQKIDGIEYVSMGAGLICPKENAKRLDNQLKDAYQSAIDMDVKENGAAAIIEREYFNCECQISMNNDECVSAIYGHKEKYPNLFTDELIKNVCKDAFNKAVLNDWF